MSITPYEKKVEALIQTALDRLRPFGRLHVRRQILRKLALSAMTLERAHHLNKALRAKGDTT